MIDTLKSIHFHTSSTVDPAWSISIGSIGQHDLKTLCTALMLDGCTLPPDLSIEDYLLILLVLLSAINTLQFSLGPLTSVSISVRGKAISFCRQTPAHNSLDQRPTTLAAQSLTTTQSATTSPYIPFTTDRDYNHLRNRLIESLLVWQKSFAARGMQVPDTAKVPLLKTESVMTLLHLARLLLDGGPALYVVPSLAGYTAEPYEALAPSVPRPCSPHKIGILFSDEAVQIAIKVLESVEDAQSTLSTHDNSAGQTTVLSPMWFPFALFYGALVLWGRLEEEEQTLAAAKKRKSSNRPFLASRRILQGFYNALKAIEQDWDCAIRMAEIVRTLIK